MSLRPWHTYVGFLLSALLVLFGMGWVSKTTLDLERNQAVARHKALVEENVRLALWRMDSAVAPIIAAEGARPYFTYSAYFAANRPYENMLNDLSRDNDLQPSPLLTGTPPGVKLHFQYVGSQSLSSPQVPPRQFVRRAMTDTISAGQIASSQEKLQALSRILDRSKLLTASIGGEQERRQLDAVNRYENPPAAQEQAEDAFSDAVQQVKSNVEWSKRAGVVFRASTYGSGNSGFANIDGNLAFDEDADESGVAAPPSVVQLEESAMSPVWVTNELFLVRQTVVGPRTYIQGAWLNWKHIEKMLLDEVQDLLPNARLVPSQEKLQEEDTRRLAALPVRLEPGELPQSLPPNSTPVRLTLAVAWSGAVFALLAFGALLLGAMSLSERRADFVSAVTHELRTPLTTFQMYTEMLSTGMLKDESKRQRYLDTLRRESVRLSHLVENVLSYARIERGRDAKKQERFDLGDLVARFEDRLSERCIQAEMQLDAEVETLEVVGDPGAVEQILFNLVDNACKYAKTAKDRTVHVKGTTSGAQVHLRVWDHGPGVSVEDGRRLFSPFSKSAHRAANSAPGVGLGLALSRRLARAMGGDLVLEPKKQGIGASFRLELPAAPADNAG